MSLRSTAATSARSISAPVASPPACTTRASEWPPSREQQLVAVGTGLGVEARAERGELANPIGSLGHEHLHGLDVAEPGARASVSARCSSAESGAASAAATPPCA